MSAPMAVAATTEPTAAAATLVPVDTRAHGASFTYLALRRLRESPTNPRRIFGALAELAASLREHGVLEPLVVRPVDGARNNGRPDHEIVAGHRRFRAATIAQLAEVPCLVRQLDDKQVLEIQLIENLQREGLHELDESDGYVELVDRHGYDAEQLAAKIGKSKSYVYARLKLRALCQPVRDAWLNGDIDASRALRLARIPTAALQAQALGEITTSRGMGWMPWTVREVEEHIARHYTLDLGGAPFSRELATLVPEAGACTSCPHNTRNQPELERAANAPDLCTDIPCYRRKVDAEWKRRAQLAKSGGVAVVNEKESKEIFVNGRFRHDQKRYTDLEQYSPQLGAKWGAKLAKHKPAQPDAIARDDDGNIRELYETSKLIKLAKDAGIERPRSAADAQNDQWRKAERTRRVNHAREMAERAALGRQLGDAAFDDKSGELWRVVLQHLLDHTHRIEDKPCRDAVARRLRVQPKRGVKKNQYRLDSAGTKAIAALSGDVARAASLELLAFVAELDDESLALAQRILRVTTRSLPTHPIAAVPAAKKPAAKPATFSIARNGMPAPAPKKPGAKKPAKPAPKPGARKPAPKKAAAKTKSR